MKMLIISDIHGNWPALQAVLAAEPDSDQVLCLGDLVNYGPEPAACVAWVMKHVADGRLVQGNHDRAVGCGEEPHCSESFRSLAAATQAMSEQALAAPDKAFLANHQPWCSFHIQGAHCVACHAVPSDPLYQYLPAAAAASTWAAEVVCAGEPDFLFLGHTHIPMQRKAHRTWIINPGSVGQPRDGDARAAYAVWTDGAVTLHHAAYPVEETLRTFNKTTLAPDIVRALGEVLRTGGKT